MGYKDPIFFAQNANGYPQEMTEVEENGCLVDDWDKKEKEGKFQKIKVKRIKLDKKQKKRKYKNDERKERDWEYILYRRYIEGEREHFSCFPFSF